MGEKTQDISTTTRELQELKGRIIADIDNFLALMKNSGEQTSIFQKELQDAHWYLGEERAKKEALENEIQDKNRYIHGLEEELQQIRSALGDAQWYLGEERAKFAQAENTIKGYQERCRSLEEQMQEIRAHCEQLQKQLQDTQWYLGEERARRQQLENQKT